MPLRIAHHSIIIRFQLQYATYNTIIMYLTILSAQNERRLQKALICSADVCNVLLALLFVADHVFGTDMRQQCSADYCTSASHIVYTKMKNDAFPNSIEKLIIFHVRNYALVVVVV